MPLQIIRNDITKMKVDAIVNAANSTLAPGGGVCGAIHDAAGPELALECSRLGGCRTGMSKITGAYKLPCRYVIHTVGPIWQGGSSGEEEALRSCYITSLDLARDKGLENIAFPLISSGIFGYPPKDAFKVATRAITDWLMDNEMQVLLAVFNKESLGVSKALYADIKEFIDDNYVAEMDSRFSYNRRKLLKKELTVEEFDSMTICQSCETIGLDSWLDQIDESFSEMVLRKIEEKGMTNAECYKKANLDKKLFSKIKGNPDYHPKKSTALALAVALELSLDETKDLLMKAGFALSHSSLFDLIVEYFIARGFYDIFEINEVLFSYDQPLLGISIL